MHKALQKMVDDFGRQCEEKQKRARPEIRKLEALYSDYMGIIMTQSGYPDALSAVLEKQKRREEEKRNRPDKPCSMFQEIVDEYTPKETPWKIEARKRVEQLLNRLREDEAQKRREDMLLMKLFLIDEQSIVRRTVRSTR